MELPNLSNDHLFITGAFGFVADALIDAFTERHPNLKISATDIRPSEAWKNRDITYYQADITDYEQVSAALQAAKPSIIIHTAGVVPGGPARYGRWERDTVFKINVDGTKNMLRAAKAAGVRAFVHTSTCCIVTDDMNHEYPNMDESLPTGAATLIYGESKGFAEEPVLAANSRRMATCAIRPSVIIGPKDYQFVPSVHACIAKWETPFIIGNGENLYDFAYVSNVAYAHVLAVENLLTTKTAGGEAMFISNQEPVPFRDFMRAIWAEFGHVPPFEVRIPERLAWFAGCLAECVTWLTGTEATLSRGSVLDATGTRYASGEKARRLLGYEPKISLAEGLRLSCAAYRKRLENRRDPSSDLASINVHAVLKRIKSPYWFECTGD